MSVKIVRSSKRGRFAAIPNALLRDPNLSDRARGLLCRMLSHADGHGPAAAAELAQGATEGRDAISKAQAELERAGYLVRRKRRQPDGRLITEVTIYDHPQRPDGASSQVAPDPDSQEPAGPAQTSVSAGGSGPGFSVTGGDLQERASSQVAPDTGSQEPAPPAQTSVSAGRTGSGFSVTNQKTREDQEKKTKKISQRAQELEARAWLHSEYDGLTEFVITHTFQVAHDRALRAGRPVENLTGYLRSWAMGDLAAVLSAAMDIEEADQAEPAPEPPAEPDPPPLHALQGKGRSSDTPTQSPLLHAIPTHQDQDDQAPLYDREAGEDRRTAAPLLAELKQKWNTGT